MRTYTRKIIRNEYTEPIESVRELCRLCLEEAKESVPIFINDKDMCTSLATRIMMCVGFEIIRDECLPDAICADCHKKLNSFYEFRKKCTLSYQKLKSHVLAVKAKKTNDTPAKCDMLNQTELTAETESSNQYSNDQMLVTINGNSNLHLPIVNGSEASQVSDSEVCRVMIGPDVKCVEISTLPPPEIEVCTDVSEFISSILIEMGVLSKNYEEVTLLENCRTIEVVTGDCSQMTLELLEIGEEQKNNVSSQESKQPVIEQKDIIASVEFEPNTQKKVKYQQKDRPRCEVCGKRFATRGVLRRHARTHSGERPYACARCGRCFGQRSVLRRHELVHQEERPFKCEACPKSFTQRGALAAHARAHAPPHARALALHRCAHCPKVFLHASGLSRHAMSHQGRQFPCARCGRKFADQSSLRRHTRLKHPHPDRHS